MLIELFIVLYLMSGSIKLFFAFYGIPLPIDLTLLTGVILFIFGIDKVLVYKEKIDTVAYRNSFFFLSIFYIWLLVSITYSHSSSYSYEKAFLFLTNILAFMAIIFNKDVNLKLIIRLFFVITFLLTAIFLPSLFNYQIGLSSDAIYDIQGFYLSSSFIIALLLVVIVTSKIGTMFNSTEKTIYIVLSIALLLILGGRGPLLFALILIFFSKIFSNKNKNASKNSIAGIFIFLLIASFSFFLINTYFSNQYSILLERTVSRLMAFNSDNGFDNSTNTRIDHYIYSFDMIFSNPKMFFLGGGIGSYGILRSGIDDRAYPHNLFLEIQFELGFIGLSLFFIFIYYIFRQHNKATSVMSVYTLLYFLLEVSKSSSLVDLRIVFFFVGLSFISLNTLKDNNNAIKKY